MRLVGYLKRNLANTVPYYYIGHHFYPQQRWIATPSVTYNIATAVTITDSHRGTLITCYADTRSSA